MTRQRTPKDPRPTVTINGRRYYIEVKEPNHGFWHEHDEDHADGTFGDTPHHHCSYVCEWLPAMLKPVRPKNRPLHRG